MVGLEGEVNAHEGSLQTGPKIFLAVFVLGRISVVLQTRLEVSSAYEQTD